jgi:hypothetical protein
MCILFTNFWMPQPVFMKLGMYIIAPGPISITQFINPPISNISIAASQIFEVIIIECLNRSISCHVRPFELYCNRTNDISLWNSSSCWLRRFSHSSVESFLCPLQLVGGHEIFPMRSTGCFENRDVKRTSRVWNCTITWPQGTICISGI